VGVGMTDDVVANSVQEVPVEITLLSDWKKYYFRWIVFGFVGGGLQPVLHNLDEFWTVKLMQCIGGLPYGLLCAVVFTLVQNKFNGNRDKKKTWIFIFSVWMSMKFVIAGLFY
jgi:hypothetical protein